MNKARIASSNKTGIVLKISLVLFILLGLLVYKLNDYFKADKVEAMQGQIRNRVVSIKTTVSGQLSQLKNVLSSYENDVSDANVNWVQLDPFFALARVQVSGSSFQVSQLVVRSNTPAERWNAGYLEKALKVNRAKERNDISVQLFKDRENTKFVLIRFATSGDQEIVVAGTAEYFQKYFDIERGSRNKSLLITTENILAGHTEPDYIANSSKEAKLSAKKYIFEKEEIAGTNLHAVSYVLRSRVLSGLAVPWSIIGVVIGFGFVLIGIIYWSLDPIERRVERYRKQEREQIYKDTMQDSLQTLAAGGDSQTNSPDVEQSRLANDLLSVESPVPFKTDEGDDSGIEVTKTAPIFKIQSENKPPEISRIELDESDANEELSQFSIVKTPEQIQETAEKRNDLYNLLESSIPNKEESDTPSDSFAASQNQFNFQSPQSENSEFPQNADSFLTLDEEKIDLDEIEKALALDDFEEEEKNGNVQAEALEQNLKPQKVSLSTNTTPIERPQFSLHKKEFQVDQIKVHVRRPERS